MAMLSEATLHFVAAHREDDVRQLALRGCRDAEVDIPAALQQIAGWQTARRKLPTWAATEGLLYPPHLSMEQCSSEATARYKCSVSCDTFAAYGTEGTGATTLVDLTGGFGVDFSFLSQSFGRAVYVERQEELCQLARHNFQQLGLTNTEVVCADGGDYLRQLSHATMIFLDPARRDSHGGRTYAISDCTPDVLSLRKELLQKADYVMLKLSPMLDWRKAVQDLGEPYVRQVHAVAVGGECKELLLVLSKRGKGLRQVAWQDGQAFEPIVSIVSIASIESIASMPFLYEPHAAVMKLGCFEALEASFPVRQIAPNSHLFMAESPVENFPGRGFQVVATTSMNKKELKKALAGIRQANITVRKFPLTVAELRKRLKLSEGGSNYLFATTLASGCHVVFLCQRLQ